MFYIWQKSIGNVARLFVPSRLGRQLLKISEKKKGVKKYDVKNGKRKGEIGN